MKDMFYKETNFKETPIGRIPKDWRVARVGEIMEFVKGKKPEEMTDEYEENCLPYLSTEYLRENKATKFVKNPKDVVLASDEDLILLWDGSNAGEFFLGKRGVLSSTMVKIELREKTYDQKFLFYLLKMKENYLKEQTRGTGIPHVDGSVLSNLIIPQPLLQEQQKIAEILSTVDEAIQKTSEIIAKTERLKKGLMQELLTKGIGHKEFKDTEIGRIPKEWEVVKLGELAVEVYRYPTYYNIKYVGANEGVPEVRGELIKENGELEENLSEYRFISKETSQRFPKTILQEGDFVLSVRGTMGKVAIVPKFLEGANITANLMKVSLDRLKCYPPFFKQVFLSDFFRKTLNNISSRTTIKTVQAPRLKSIKMSLPPLHEQKRIAEILSTVDKKLEIERNEKAKLEKIKQGLMDLLLTGKIRVKVT
jgi:type I restriction enzyme S subunit